MGIFYGLYADYATAQPLAQSYDDGRVVARLAEIQGAAAWDGTLHPLAQQLAAAFLTALVRAGHPDRRIRVCDVGGGLGGSRTALAGMLGDAWRLDWDIVETPALARVGNERFAHPLLRFHDSLDALEGREHDIIIASGVLQYLPAPAATFERLARRPHHHLLLNRFPIRHAPGGVQDDICTIQDLAALLPGVNVPHWCFSKDRWQNLMAHSHACVMHWTDSFDGRHPLPDGSEVSFIGMLLSRMHHHD